MSYKQLPCREAVVSSRIISFSRLGTRSRSGNKLKRNLFSVRVFFFSLSDKNSSSSGPRPTLDPLINIAKQQGHLKVAVNIVSHRGDLHHLLQLLRVTRHQVEKGQLLEVFRLLKHPHFLLFSTECYN